ncbi:MAG: hypothetical protein ACREBW_06215, partial [Candidatus Micrarchaeaceae archaeon]
CLLRRVCNDEMEYGASRIRRQIRSTGVCAYFTRPLLDPVDRQAEKSAVVVNCHAVFNDEPRTDARPCGLLAEFTKALVRGTLLAQKVLLKIKAVKQLGGDPKDHEIRKNVWHSVSGFKYAPLVKWQRTK